MHVISRYRDSASNLRTQLGRILAKAGLEPWPKLWQNLRASRQTELAADYPIHVVCAWIGNSAAVARDHHLQVRDSDFERASALPDDRTQNRTQQATAGMGNDGKPGTTNANNPRHFPPLPTLAFNQVGPVGLEPTTKGL